MIQISRDIFVSSKDLKDVSLIENPASVKITYYVKIQQERTLYFSSIEAAKAFKKHILHSIEAEEAQIEQTACKQAIAINLLQKIRELLDDNP